MERPNAESCALEKVDRLKRRIGENAANEILFRDMSPIDTRDSKTELADNYGFCWELLRGGDVIPEAAELLPENPAAVGLMMACYLEPCEYYLSATELCSPGIQPVVADEKLDYLQLRTAQNKAWAEVHLSEGIAAAKADKFDAAIERCNTALAFCPNLVEALVCRGASYSNKGNFQRSLADLGQALRLDPSNTDARYYLSSVENQSHSGWRGEGITNPLQQRFHSAASSSTSSNRESSSSSSSDSVYIDPRMVGSKSIIKSAVQQGGHSRQAIGGYEYVREEDELDEITLTDATTSNGGAGAPYRDLISRLSSQLGKKKRISIDGGYDDKAGKGADAGGGGGGGGVDDDSSDSSSSSTSRSSTSSRRSRSSDRKHSKHRKKKRKKERKESKKLGKEKEREKAKTKEERHSKKRRKHDKKKHRKSKEK